MRVLTFIDFANYVRSNVRIIIDRNWIEMTCERSFELELDLRDNVAYYHLWISRVS